MDHHEDTEHLQDDDTDIDANIDANIEQAPRLRRSTRTRRKPDWYQSEDYCISKQHSAFLDWKERCTFLSDLMKTHPNHGTKIMTVLLSIITTV